jgi:hypothetical protein
MLRGNYAISGLGAEWIGAGLDDIVACGDIPKLILVVVKVSQRTAKLCIYLFHHEECSESVWRPDLKRR